VDGHTATVTASAEDALTPIKAFQYAVDSTSDWQPVLPDDLLFDSTKEGVTIKIPDLKAGPHVVTLRATDERNNARYEAVKVDVK